MSLITRREICAFAAVMPLGAIASPAQAFLAKAGAEKSPKAELSVLIFPGFETIDPWARSKCSGTSGTFPCASFPSRVAS